MSHNVNLPTHRYVLVREAFLFDGVGTGTVPAALHGASSTPSRAMGFHVLLENGARWSDLPLHALCTKPEAPERKLSDLSRWDCLGWSLTTVEYEYLREMDVRVRLGGGEEVFGQYVCSFDWTDGFSLEPTQHKEMHLIELREGNFALMPNNNLCWIDKSFVEPYTEPPGYVVQSRRWYSEE